MHRELPLFFIGILASRTSEVRVQSEISAKNNLLIRRSTALLSGAAFKLLFVCGFCPLDGQDSSSLLQLVYLYA